MTPKISIIIPTYNHCDDLLKPCISSIIQYTDLTDIEVIICANGCTDNTKEYVESLGKPFKLVWIEQNAGFPGAINAGLKSALGDYIILLNNDIVLLEQEKNRWIYLLTSPFSNGKIGITGSYGEHNLAANKYFLVFFCVAIKREVITKLGLLDEIFSPGGCEDVDYCVKAVQAGFELKRIEEYFPIYHKLEQTRKEDPKFQEIHNRNSQIVAERYNHQWKLGNNWERAVIDKDEPIPPREHARYSWAKENIVGKKVLDVGCSSGYSWRYLKDIEGIEYLGIDKDEKVIEFAKQNFGDRFQVADINTFELGQYDTIIAFEFLEHLDNGKELAQKLKEHCKCLLTSVPYKEQVGTWGPHHKLHKLSEIDFGDFEYNYVTTKGLVEKTPDDFNGMNLMLMKWEQGKTYALPKIEFKELEEGITVHVSTGGRYDTTLPLFLLSIANQTLLPKKLVIYDDNVPAQNLRNHPLYQNIFGLLNLKGIKWAVGFGVGKGQVLNHQRAIDEATTEFLYRGDDDTVLEPNVLEELMSRMEEDVAAVAPIVLHPNQTVYNLPKYYSYNQIEYCEDQNQLNIQWFKHPDGEVKSVDHLYSTFLYRREAFGHGYNKELSPVGHREESLLTYEAKRSGWKLLVDPNAVVNHFRYSTGGIRASEIHNQANFNHDAQIFLNKLKEWGVVLKTKKLIVLDNGLGDHYVFKKLLPEVKAKYRDVVIAVCYPEVFEDEKEIELISIADANISGDKVHYNVYKWMAYYNWKGSLENAYRQMYNI